MRRFLHDRTARRWVSALCFAALLATACGGDSSDPAEAAAPTTVAQPGSEATDATGAEAPATTTTVPPTTTTTEAEPAPDYQPAVLSYRYPSGGELVYDISIEQQAEISIEGDSSEEMPPGAIEMVTTLEGTVSYRISTGPDENTTTIRILSDLEIVDNQMSMGGISMPAPPDSEAPGFETPIDITIVVDRQGNVQEFSSEALDSLLGGEGLMPANAMGSQQLNRPFGPAFPDSPVDVGDSWTELREQEGPPGLGTIVTTAEHRLAGAEPQGGRSILVVESEYLTEAFEWDMSELLGGMFGAFAGELDEEQAGEGEAALADLTMLIAATPTTVTAVARYDAEAGLVVEGNYQVSGGVTTNMTIPDQTGEASGLISTITYDQTITYRLADPVT